MLFEELELERLVAAAHAAASTGNMQTLKELALLTSLESQQQYAKSASTSNGWMWHPYSCAAFGCLNRMQAALCGDTDDLLCTPKQPLECVEEWVFTVVFLWQPTLAAIDTCTAVLRRFSGCASKPNKAANTQLMEAITDLWQNLADASRAVAYLHYIQELQETGADFQREASVQSNEPISASEPSGVQEDHQGQPCEALSRNPSSSGTLTHQQRPPWERHARGVLTNPEWLQPCVGFLDALLCFFGEESADVPPGPVADFVVVAGAFKSVARVQAVQNMVEKHAVHSNRVQGLLGSTAWEHLEPGLQQLLQMPGARVRKKQRRD